MGNRISSKIRHSIGLLFGAFGILALATYLSGEKTHDHDVLKIEEKLNLYAEISNDLGFGGAIHDFKNYVLRGDSHYLENSKSKFLSAKKSILTYLEIEDLVPAETENLTQIKSVLDLYLTKIKILEDKKSSDLDIRHLDRKVRVDDSPAIRGRRALGKHLQNERIVLEESLIKSLSKVRHNLYLGFTLGGMVVLFLVFYFSSIVREEKMKVVQSSKLATLGEMAAGIAHEINNPLAIIQGTAKVLQRKSDSPETIIKSAERLEHSVERISKIVRGLQKYARKSEKTHLASVSLLKLVEEAVVLTSSKLDESRVDVRYNKDHLARIEIQCDEIYVSQIFVNLISNAIDANIHHPSPWIEIQHHSEKGEFDEIRFIDSGNGIDQKTRAKLFDPFFTTKAVGKGTGLGLSICKGLAEELGGSLKYSPQNGHTAFSLAIPSTDDNKGLKVA